ncbi:RT0821/Lpp0805 family surface protein [Salinisphaera sp. SPP-AMP-43]|uniref:RT0821/Lpp0805 family surface protein n=1 Tax=Salinisphaera sp. SPP-AMP-43 TaxID=3121288 RepID=UPI003C6E2FB9
MGLSSFHQAQAFNFRFLDSSAVARFTDEDWQVLRDATRQALNHGSDGDTITWRNDKTGHWGTITPSPASDRAGATCRRTRFVANAAQRTSDTTVTFCRIDGQWKVAQ